MSTPNRLINATSPYLQQHARNPVDWFEWGPEALTKAKQEDKPIIVSIGYSACHWCHVMERESFESTGIAKIMNDNFVCIKVDREERPDVDQVYMEAVQAMGMNGGWPLNVFLTPDQKPFYGGTYFPPRNWAQLLAQISKAFRDKRAEINSSANDILTHLNTGDLSRFAGATDQENFTRLQLDQMFEKLKSKFDFTWGGIDKAPKFCMPSIWQFLLRYYYLTKEKTALDMVEITLSKMVRGGIYDQLCGGFSRYSVDREWFAPHFEKMLYDNAQLISLLSEVFAVTQKPLFKKVVYETIDWLEKEMTSPDGGFYSALDADSEGVEGKFYAWTWQELKEVLTQEELEAAAGYFSATEEGNWEHGRNILTMHHDDEAQSEIIEGAKRKLTGARSKRVRPGLDDKIIAGWNAMMIKGVTDAGMIFGNEKFLALARQNLTFLEKRMMKGNQIFRSFKERASSTEGFLEDYALVIQAYLFLYQATFDETLILKAAAMCEYVVENFYDKGEGFFNFTSNQAEKLISRKKEIFDNVIPSSNSIMARNLIHLGIMMDRDVWKANGEKMTARLSKMITKEPTYMSNWGIALAELFSGIDEVVVTGPGSLNSRLQAGKKYIPFSLWMGADQHSGLPLVRDKFNNTQEAIIYVCRNKTCRLPVKSVEEALRNIAVNRIGF